jgi:hypothetical protein
MRMTILLVLLVISSSSTAAIGAGLAKTNDVMMENYGGWPDCLVMRGGDCKAIVVPAVGGRVLSYAVNGENILFENPEAAGRTLLTSSNGFWAGGYQCDIGPEVRGIPKHEWLWNGPWNWRVPGPFSVHTFSDPARAVGVRLDKEFVIDPDSGDLGVTQRLRNVVTSDVSFCLWDRTLCKGGGFAMFPLNRKSRFRAGWSIRRGSAGSFNYDGDKPSDARVRILDGVLVAQAKSLPGARELKVGADSDAGWIAYVRGKVLFVKYFPVFPRGNYSDGGNSVEFYCSERVAELEPLSPEVSLKPGGNYSFPEKWTLIELAEEVTTYNQARALVKRIARSPFER